MEPRLNLSNKSITIHILRLTGEQHFLNLIRLILIGLLSDFMEFISSNISSQSSFNDDSTQLSLSKCNFFSTVHLPNNVFCFNFLRFSNLVFDEV